MDQVYLIVGLGNPGREYERTRHNAGFLVVEHWVGLKRAVWSLESRFSARVAKIRVGEAVCVVCEPQTFMNLSGEAVGKVSRFYRVPPERVMVVVDDADLPLGQLRLRPGGSSGGHHGLDSVETHLGTREYPRQRVGIGRQVVKSVGKADGKANEKEKVTEKESSSVRSADRDIAGYVLGRFSVTEEVILRSVVERAVGQLEAWVTDGLQKAMNQFNGAAGPS